MCFDPASASSAPGCSAAHSDPTQKAKQLETAFTRRVGMSDMSPEPLTTLPGVTYFPGLSKQIMLP